MTSCDRINETDNLSEFEINTFLLHKDVSLKIHEKEGIKLPKVVHLKNDYQVVEDQGFPFISYNPRIELPVESKKKGKRVTVCVSLLTPAPDQTLAMDRPAQTDATSPDLSALSVHSTPLATESENLTFECVRDGLTYISLPAESRDLVFNHSKNSSLSGDTVPTSCNPVSSLEIRQICSAYMFIFEYWDQCFV